MSVELWKPIEGYEDYQVSNMGRVRSLKAGKCLVMKQSVHSAYGHLVVNLSQNSVRTLFRVHRLVCTAFHGECPPGMECCHNDGNSSNNLSSNLRWDTHASNSADKIKHGTTNKGTKNPCAKLDNEKVQEIRALLASGVHQVKIAKLYGVGTMAVAQIKKNRTWKHVPIAPGLAEKFVHGHIKGETHYNSKVTNDIVREIRKLLASGIPQKVIAAQFNLSKPTISHINTGRKWAHVI